MRDENDPELCLYLRHLLYFQQSGTDKVSSSNRKEKDSITAKGEIVAFFSKPASYISKDF